MRGVKTISIAAAVSVALLTGAATTAPAARSATCTYPVAKAAIAQVKPYIRSLANTPMLVTPGMADQLLCFDFTRDGLRDLAVTIASGGTAGDIAWLVLQRTHTGWRLALQQSPRYKIGIYRVGGDVADAQPVFRKNDPNCCPTGGVDHSRWHWNGHRFVVVRRWHTTSYRV